MDVLAELRGQGERRPWHALVEHGWDVIRPVPYRPVWARLGVAAARQGRECILDYDSTRERRYEYHIDGGPPLWEWEAAEQLGVHLAFPAGGSWLRRRRP